MQQFFDSFVAELSAVWAAYPNTIVVLGALLALWIIISLVRASGARSRMEARFAAAQTELTNAIGQLTSAAQSASGARQAAERAMQEAAAAAQRQADAHQAALTQLRSEFAKALEQLKGEARAAFDAKAGALLEASSAQGKSLAEQAAAFREEMRRLVEQGGSNSELLQRVETLHKAVEAIVGAAERRAAQQPLHPSVAAPAESGGSLEGSRLI